MAKVRETEKSLEAASQMSRTKIRDIKQDTSEPLIGLKTFTLKITTSKEDRTLITAFLILDPLKEICKGSRITPEAVKIALTRAKLDSESEVEEAIEEFLTHWGVGPIQRMRETTPPSLKQLVEEHLAIITEK